MIGNLIDKFAAMIPYLNTPFMIKIIKSVLIIIILWMADLIILKVIYKRVGDVKIRYRWRKFVNYIGILVGSIFIGRIWFVAVQSLATFMGLFSAGVAIALKDLILNLAGWFYIIARRPFEVGDRIQIEGDSGDVIDLGLLEFSLLEIRNWVDSDQSTGRIINVPNGKIFNSNLANFDKGFKYIWNEIPVLITFESNWQKAKKILGEIASKHSEITSSKVEQEIKRAARKYMIFYNKLTPIVYTDVKNSGVMLTIRYLCETRKRRGSQQRIWENILTEFAKHNDIDLAYPTQRFYDNVREGKKYAADFTSVKG